MSRDEEKETQTYMLWEKHKFWETVDKNSCFGFLINFAYFHDFAHFFLNSGGRELPGEVVEIDFRQIFKKMKVFSFNAFVK